MVFRYRVLIPVLILSFLFTLGLDSHEEEGYLKEAREKMVELIKTRGITDKRVLAAMLKVPRHLFVDRSQWRSAYDDRPLPIGFGQTISQPYIVALMTESLNINMGDRVLEVGTGSGYQCAILAELTDKVYSVEIIEELGRKASMVLKELGYKVRIKIGDGYNGWEEYAPFDAIIVTCAPDHIPTPLIQQLKVGGRMVIPVGPTGLYQTLWLITKEKEDKLVYKNLGDVLFVPLVRR
ncbi:MAG TPA: protein-L-isoaspartate(D-aspartate) O-methyltransferase [bacterium]|nr:protein-L-isoaspartate(D-aspartate) O-methyltransferase [bacterium]HPC78388.1 protein-L-isoaspartate(D-aspartate) O-methyltransferase [bacterium]HRU31840.1 protein-L-isoaspartate(D-aspartate) O-methyltransferase [bacterium]